MYEGVLYLHKPFSIQDSLGGNSKTTIIANVSSSIWYNKDKLEAIVQVAMLKKNDFDIFHLFFAALQMRL